MTTAKKNTELSKAEEIALIEKLEEGKGYWSEYFGTDAHQMCTNIKNDFPVEFATKVKYFETVTQEKIKEANELQEKLNSQNQRVAKLEKELAGRNLQLECILDRLVRDWNNGEATSPVDFFTWSEVTRARLLSGITLSYEDNVELLKKAGI